MIVFLRFLVHFVSLEFLLTELMPLGRRLCLLQKMSVSYATKLSLSIKFDKVEKIEQFVFSFLVFYNRNICGLIKA